MFCRKKLCDRQHLNFAIVSLVPSLVDVGLLLLLRQAGLPLIGADVVAVSVASFVSYFVHRSSGGRSNPYSRWTERPLLYVLIAAAAGATDVALLRVIYALTGFASVQGLLAAKVLSLACAAVVRVSGYRHVLGEIIRRNHIAQPRRLAPAPFKLTVVLPAYRAADVVSATVQALRAELDDVATDGGVEIVVVDDGSGDRTAAVALEAGADQVVELDHNFGKGHAVRVGILAARGAIIAFTDVDLAYHPRHLREIVRKVDEGWDVVIGNRRNEDSSVVRSSGLRSAGSRLVNWLSAIALLDAPLDTQCGLKGFRREVGRTVFQQARVDGFAFDIEILHLVERAGFSMTDIPVDLDESAGPTTVSVLRDTIKLFGDMLRVRHWASAGAYDEISSPWTLIEGR